MSFWEYVKHHKIVFLWSTIGGGLMPLAACSACMDSLELYVKVATFNIAIWVMMWFGNGYLNLVLDKKLSWTEQTLKRMFAGVVAMLAYSPTMVFILAKFFGWIFDLYLGNISAILYFSIIITSLVTLVLTSRSFLLNWRQTAIDAERLQKESIISKYENLKSQVNPHFLFNSLNALTNLVYEDQDKAAKFIKQLSEVYRYVLDTRHTEIVPLDQELKFLRSYLYLQQIRFGDKLRVELKLDNIDTLVAPLSLQMLVENAIKHNVISEENPLLIRIFSDNEYLIVENPVQKKLIVAEESSGLGLENICKRYEFLSDREVMIVATDQFFSVKLPLLKSFE